MQNKNISKGRLKLHHVYETKKMLPNHLHKYIDMYTDAHTETDTHEIKFNTQQRTKE